jgi:nifR3 family TIM-barrel protein
MSFWKQLPKPFFTIAPMADVTDVAFRRVITKYGKPDVMWTEFVSADGLALAPAPGRQKLLADLNYTDSERPIVAQLFSSNEAHMEAASRLCRELGFDGIDINMGCPDRSIEKQGCGAAMIQTPDIAVRIIRAVKRGAGDLPVSVKTRVGYLKDEIDTWIPTLLAEDLAALTVHARTRKEMSKVPADWESIARVVTLRDKLAPATLIVGNGDVLSLADAHQKIAQSGADGAMVGRALFGNPWLFNPSRQLPLTLHALPTHGVDRETLVSVADQKTDIEYVSLEERLLVMTEHSKLFTELLPHKSFSIMKKHYKAYVCGFENAASLRARLMECEGAEEVGEVVATFLSSHQEQN